MTLRWERTVPIARITSAMSWRATATVRTGIAAGARAASGVRVKCHPGRCARTPIAAAAHNGLREAITDPPYYKTPATAPTSAQRDEVAGADEGFKNSRSAAERGAESRLQGQVADASTRCCSDCVADCRRRRALRTLTRAEERLSRAVDDMHVDAFRHGGETHDRVAAPVATGDAARSKPTSS